MLSVTVRFSEELPLEIQGPALMAFERKLRQLTGQDCRVFKEKQADDSKLRVRMTQAERDRL